MRACLVADDINGLESKRQTLGSINICSTYVTSCSGLPGTHPTGRKINHTFCFYKRIRACFLIASTFTRVGIPCFVYIDVCVFFFFFFSNKKVETRGVFLQAAQNWGTPHAAYGASLRFQVYKSASYTYCSIGRSWASLGALSTRNTVSHQPHQASFRAVPEPYL